MVKLITHALSEKARIPMASMDSTRVNPASPLNRFPVIISPVLIGTPQPFHTASDVPVMASEEILKKSRGSAGIANNTFSS
jgi:hypothetical protein